MKERHRKPVLSGKVNRGTGVWRHWGWGVTQGDSPEMLPKAPCPTSSRTEKHLRDQRGDNRDRHKKENALDLVEYRGSASDCWTGVGNNMEIHLRTAGSFRAEPGRAEKRLLQSGIFHQTKTFWQVFAILSAKRCSNGPQGFGVLLDIELKHSISLTLMSIII